MDRLERWVGLSGPVLHWFSTYLTGQEFVITLGEDNSENTYLMWHSIRFDFGISTVRFYMLTLGSVIRKHSIDFHCYADDTQLYISVSPEDFSSSDKLLDCINDLMAPNFLQLNQDKAEELIAGAKVQRENLAAHFNSQAIKLKHQVKHLDVILDSQFRITH